MDVLISRKVPPRVPPEPEEPLQRGQHLLEVLTILAREDLAKPGDQVSRALLAGHSLMILQEQAVLPDDPATASIHVLLQHYVTDLR